MTNEIALRTAEALTEKQEWSKAMSIASLLPQQYRNNPGNLLFAIEYADALGIERINAITSIYVVEGKPSASADLIAGLIRKAGHKLRVYGDDVSATAELIRADDPEFTYTATWNLERARVAGLSSKAVWKNYPAAMLRSRAITEVGRMGASDALLGVVYTPEELNADVDDNGNPKKASAITKNLADSSGADRLKSILNIESEIENAQEVDPKTGEIINSADRSNESVDKSADKVTPEQTNTIGALLTTLGMTDSAIQLAYVGDVVEHAITSPSQLTFHEADRVIAYLQKDVEKIEQTKLATEANRDE